MEEEWGAERSGADPEGASGARWGLGRLPWAEWETIPGSWAESLWSDRNSKISQVLCREWLQTNCQAQGKGAGSVWVQLLPSLGEVGLGPGSTGV